MAEVSQEKDPTSTPHEGHCFVSDDGFFTVSLVGSTPAEGWAVWYIGGPTMRILANVPLRSAAQGKALASALGRVVRGVGLLLRVRAVVRAVLDNERAAKAARPQRRPGVVVLFERKGAR